MQISWICKYWDLLKSTSLFPSHRYANVCRTKALQWLETWSIAKGTSISDVLTSNWNISRGIKAVARGMRAIAFWIWIVLYNRLKKANMYAFIVVIKFQSCNPCDFTLVQCTYGSLSFLLNELKIMIETILSSRPRRKRSKDEGAGPSNSQLKQSSEEQSTSEVGQNNKD